MPLKLIGMIVLMVLVATFTGFNLDNRCNIWFFHTFEHVPVFATILGSFVAGVIVTLPFTIARRSKAEKAPKPPRARHQKKQAQSSAEIDSTTGTTLVTEVGRIDGSPQGKR